MSQSIPQRVQAQYGSGTGTPQTGFSSHAPPPPQIQQGNPWQQHKDASGRPYYYNATTRESTWNVPPRPSGVAPPQSPQSVPHRNSTSETSQAAIHNPWNSTTKPPVDPSSSIPTRSTNVHPAVANQTAVTIVNPWEGGNPGDVSKSSDTTTQLAQNNSSTSAVSSRPPRTSRWGKTSTTPSASRPRGSDSSHRDAWQPLDSQNRRDSASSSRDLSPDRSTSGHVVSSSRSASGSQSYNSNYSSADKVRRASGGSSSSGHYRSERPMRSRQTSSEDVNPEKVKKPKLSASGKARVALAEATTEVDLAVLRADIAHTKFLMHSC